MRVETEKIRQEVEIVAQTARENKTSLGVSYLYAVDDEDCKVVDADEEAASELRTREIKDLGAPNDLSLKEWEKLSNPGFPDLHRYITAKSEMPIAGSQTQYLVLQRFGKFRANDLVLNAQRVELREPIENAKLSNSKNFDATRYGSVSEANFNLGSLAPTQALRITLANIADFNEEELYTSEEVEKKRFTSPYDLSYGVVYLPRKISYRDSTSDQMIHQDVRAPFDNRVNVKCLGQIGG